MRDTLTDIVKHTGDLGFIEMAKITGTDESTTIEAMDAGKTVIVKGTLKESNDDFKGEFGINQMQLLKFYTTFPSYKAGGAKTTIIREDRNGETLPTEITFESASKDSTATYRLMNKDLIPDQYKFLGTSWDIEISPANTKIAEFSALANGLVAFESNFMPKVEDSILKFYIGDAGAATNKANMVFDDNVVGDFAGGVYWPIQQVLAILKLADIDGSSPTMSFMAKGALKISFSSSTCDWDYILPGKRK